MRRRAEREQGVGGHKVGGRKGFVQAQSVSSWSRDGRRTYEAVRSELRPTSFGDFLPFSEKIVFREKGTFL